MHQDWQAFLESQGAQIAADQTAQFEPRAADSDCAVTDLSELGVISVAGPEAVDFLQGQLSNDLRELSDTHSQLNSHCSPKGRMIANFRILRLGDALLLILPTGQVEALATRLKMFLLRAKASIEDLSDSLVCMGVIGTCADHALKAHFGELPSDRNAMAHAENAALIRVCADQDRYLLIGPVEVARSLWEAARDAGAGTAHPKRWHLADIRAGLPTVLPETRDSFIPQMANMQLIDGVSFHKGCYTGQEVVARMQYLGKLKRRMYLAEVTLPEHLPAPAPGAALSSPSSTSEQAAGRIVNSCATEPGRYEMLVVAEISAAEGGELRLGDDGPGLSISPPPYGFAPEEAQAAGG